MNSKIKIFVVDDDQVSILVISKSLREIDDHEIYTFTSTDAFLENIHPDTDIAIIDYQIDHRTGIDVAVILKEKYPRIYIIGISSQEDIGVAADFIEKGAWRYVVKNENMSTKLLQYVKDATIQIFGNRYFSEEVKDLIKFNKIF